jgi:hypothetical protein
MRTIAAAAASLLAGLATPAHATQGELCRPISGSGPTVSIVIGSSVSSAVAGVNLIEGGVVRSSFGENAPIAIAQAWIDRQRLWIDIADADHQRYEAQVRLSWVGRGRARHMAGTIARNGRVYRVRCEES